MIGRDWLVTANGVCRPCSTPSEWKLLETPYYFHRFLTQLEDSLRDYANDEAGLANVRQLARKLTLNSYWIQNQIPQLEPGQTTAVLNLYDEIGYPLTIQTVAFEPGTRSPIHNHGTWGVVAVLQGQEKNTFWRQIVDTSATPKVLPTEEKILRPGDIVSFTAQAIHCIEAVGERPLVTLNLYGETHHSQRFEFNPVTHQASNY